MSDYIVFNVYFAGAIIYIIKAKGNRYEFIQCGRKNI